MKLTIQTGESHIGNKITGVRNEKGELIAKFYGPLSKTMAETFIRAMTQTAN